LPLISIFKNLVVVLLLGIVISAVKLPFYITAIPLGIVYFLLLNKLKIFDFKQILLYIYPKHVLGDLWKDISST